MSSDDIVFGEIQIREPQRSRRPDLDRRWAAIAYELPGPDDLPVFLDLQAADAIERHALRDTSVELGGILLGKECVDEVTGKPFVWVTEALEAKHYENTQASFTYTHESWEEITRERDRQWPDLDIVGWYHTHPDFGIFLSSHDQFIHRHFFAQPLQVAYVVDPIRQTRGFFQWRNGVLAQVSGYYLTADRGDRLALARFVNDLENIPNSGAGGGGLSPRLEAELMAMLTRPYPPSAAASSGQAATLYMALGVVLGALGLALGLWLNALVNQVQDQKDALNRLTLTLQNAESKRQTDLTAAQLAAREEALNSLLGTVKAGGKPDRFATSYAELAQDRDALRLELRKQTVNYNSVFDTNQKLQAALNVTTEKLDAAEAKAKRAVALEDEVSNLKSLMKYRETQYSDKGIFRKYDYAWYAAAGGWATCILLGLGFLAVWGRAEPPPDQGLEGPAERPHTIT
jgi:proteasome lid subunit RPN8/RPN11